MHCCDGPHRKGQCLRRRLSSAPARADGPRHRRRRRDRHSPGAPATCAAANTPRCLRRRGPHLPHTLSCQPLLPDSALRPPPAHADASAREQPRRLQREPLGRCDPPGDGGLPRIAPWLLVSRPSVAGRRERPPSPAPPRAQRPQPRPRRPARPLTPAPSPPCPSRSLRCGSEEGPVPPFSTAPLAQASLLPFPPLVTSAAPPPRRTTSPRCSTASRRTTWKSLAPPPPPPAAPAPPPPPPTPAPGRSRPRRARRRPRSTGGCAATGATCAPSSGAATRASRTRTSTSATGASPAGAPGARRAHAWRTGRPGLPTPPYRPPARPAPPGLGAARDTHTPFARQPSVRRLTFF